MSYQDYQRSIESPAMDTSFAASPSPSRNPAIHRKPPANYSPIPFTSSSGSVHKHVAQFNNLRSTSISSQAPPANPTHLATKRSFSPVTTPSPASATSRSAAGSISSRTPTTPGATDTVPFPSYPATNNTSEYPPPPAHAEWHSALKSCLALQNDAVKNHKKRPFAALLLGADRATTLLTHVSISHVQHAESELARLASIQYSIEYLRKCTLVTTWEPCAMCAGTIYWSGIGRVVYAASESKLKELTGDGNNENMTMDLPCRVVLEAGQTKVDVVGPVQGWEEKVVEESRKWWREHQVALNTATKSERVNGHAAGANNGVRSVSGMSYNVITNPPPAEGVTSRIGDDGEYMADLKVDWMS